MQTMFIAILESLSIVHGAILMSDERKELEDAVMDEFEWAIQDPNTEKIRQLGEVVSIITTKLIEAIDELQGTVNQLQTQVSGFESKIDSLESRIASGATAAASPAASAGEEPIATMAKDPAAAPPAAPGGGGSMMGELKQLLAARRRKADGT